ncbi:hypothetical protein [Allosphingosinicella deserti]|uniref:hypothetical protein n=1 Tax=Allosphingosinicella deserti TaxID=2116704 RepID=UPI000D0AE4DE|nr:hypothetical protein [Sphingomonas deserti]
MILPALILAAAGQGSSEPAYPAAQILGAFGTLCGPIADLDATAKAGAAAGWERFTPEPASPIGQLVALGESEGAKLIDKAKGDAMLPVAALRRRVAGEDLVAILSGVRKDGTRVHGCRVYDVGESRAISDSDAKAWIGRAPSRRVDEAGVVLSSWEPGYRPDHDSFETYFISSGSPAAQMFKVTGISLKADFVGAAH